MSGPAAVPAVRASRRGAYGDALRGILGRSDPAQPSTRAPDPAQRQERTAALLAALGEPQLAVPLVHVAGTNGKGTTAALIGTAMSAGGSRVGLFTSPHLHSMRERIRLDMQPIDEEAFVRVYHAAVAAAAQVERAGYGQVSTLEMLMAMALGHFAESAASLVVVEAFVGGGHDITNVVTPVVSVVTNISLDHVGALGPTIADIAAAKAGIIRPNVPVVVGPQPPAALRVLRAHARSCRSPLRRARWIGRTTNAENRAVARATVRALRWRGHVVPKRRARRGAWRDMQWPARREWFHRGPVEILVDGAHCPWALRRLVAELGVAAPRRGRRNRSRVQVVFGGQRGHDPVANVRELLPLAPRRFYVTASRHPRAVPQADLAACLRVDPSLRQPLTTQPTTVAEAIGEALRVAQPGDLVIATGSLAVAAEAREALLPWLSVDPQS